MFEPQTGASITFADYNTLGDRLVDSVAPDGIMSSQGLSTSGSASYRGVLSVITSIDSETTQIIGQASLGVNFSTDSISGSVDNFLSDTDQQYQGQLSLEQGNIDRTANVDREFAFSSDISGSLQASDEAPMTVTGQLFGDFYDDGEKILGIVIATTTVNGQTTDANSGAFILSQ
ncbi:hypothetical protein LOM8899_04555 [Flavimaricola marinus]|uniref:Transferrin-binding protein B C-lobe/N-lobe beta barrel domain-containing protein n=1 Tax=Flavimaricola marinus TaxID=1819565 RepID=A0A238LL20_9RHOB|nr:hypothetical protein LOM8899_04555 [Flavimaricola marinus]